MKEEKQEGLSNTERFKNVEDVCRLIGHEWEYWSWSKTDYEYAHKERLHDGFPFYGKPGTAT